jgi:hypothetical protein
MKWPEGARDWWAYFTEGPTRRDRQQIWEQAHAAGRARGRAERTAELVDPGRLREWLRQAMNETVIAEYELLVDPLGPFGDDDSPDHRRVTMIAGNLALKMLHAAPAEETPDE